jgi:5-methylcytosine-specific restriction enzyme A
MFNFTFKKYVRYAYRSPKWRSIRNKHIKENPTCAACGRDNKLEVHHIEPVHLNPDRELDPTNLITLCGDPCHLLFGHLMNFKSYNREVVQDCLVYLEKIKNRPSA